MCVCIECAVISIGLRTTTTAAKKIRMRHHPIQFIQSFCFSFVPSVRCTLTVIAINRIIPSHRNFVHSQFTHNGIGIVSERKLISIDIHYSAPPGSFTHFIVPSTKCGETERERENTNEKKSINLMRNERQPSKRTEWKGSRKEKEIKNGDV